MDIIAWEWHIVILSEVTYSRLPLNSLMCFFFQLNVYSKTIMKLNKHLHFFFWSQQRL